MASVAGAGSARTKRPISPLKQRPIAQHNTDNSVDASQRVRIRTAWDSNTQYIPKAVRLLYNPFDACEVILFIINIEILSHVLMYVYL